MVECSYDQVARHFVQSETGMPAVFRNPRRERPLIMPCMGPDDRQDDADRAFDEIAVFLQKKYGVQDIRVDDKFGFFSDEFNVSRIQFRDALREVFKLDSYNGF